MESEKQQHPTYNYVSKHNAFQSFFNLSIKTLFNVIIPFLYIYKYIINFILI